MTFFPLAASMQDKGKKSKKVLLNNISGAAPPGRLVALMGATGGMHVHEGCNQTQL